ADCRTGGAQYSSSNRLGAARADGCRGGQLGCGALGHRIPLAHTTSGRTLDRSPLHRSRFPARVLPQVSRLLCVLPALGSVRISQPGAARSRSLALNFSGIVCALASEARHLGPITQHEPVEPLPDGTLVAVTGMGSTAASSGADALIRAGATALASFGLAGGLDPTLRAGAILLPTEVVGPAGQRVMTAEGWRERVASAVSSQSRLHRGRLIT